MVIGINGKSGSGKSIVSNLIFYNSNKQVIHLDYVFNDIKKKYLKKHTISGETINKEGKIYIDRKSSLRKILDLKYINELYNIMKNNYANRIIRKEIEDSKFDYVIIEGINLTNYNLDRICDVKILVKANNNLRYNRVLDRDIYLDKESLLEFLNENDKTDIDEHEYYIIENNGSLQELEDNIRKVEYKIKHLNK